MKKSLLLFLTLIGIINHSFPAYQNVTGGQLLYFLSSPTVMGNAGAYATESEELDALPLNPIVAAGRLYHNVNFSYLQNFDEGANGYSVSYTLPTVIGEFSLIHSGLLTTAYGLDNFFNLQILFSKIISTEFKFAFGLKATYLPMAKESPFGVVANVSLLYESKKALKEKFGFGDLKLGALVKNLGLPNIVTNAAGEEGWLEPIEIRVGAGFNILQLKFQKAGYILGLASDLAFAVYPFNFIANLAVKNNFFFSNKTFESLKINLGTFLTSQSSGDSLGYPDLIPFTFGFTLKINIDETPIGLSYAFVPENINQNLGFIHTFSFSSEFGRRDLNKPKINLGEDLEKDEIIEAEDNLPDSF